MTTLPATSPITITTTDTEAHLVVADDDTPLQERLRAVPGARFDSQARHWIVPLTYRPIRALRTALTGQPRERLVMDDTTKARLTLAAEFPPDASNITLAPDTGKFLIVAEHSTALSDDLKRLYATWEGAHKRWAVPATAAAALRGLLETHTLTADAAATEAMTNPHETLRYDGTIDGLRGVPVSDLAAVPDSKVDGFAEFGIRTVYDLLHHVPLRYLDRSALTRISDLPVGEDASVIGTIVRLEPYDRARRLTKVRISDNSGRELHVAFFNSAWLHRRFRANDEVVLHGRVDLWDKGRSPMLQMTNPMMDLVGNDTAMVVPVYPQSAKSRISTWDVHTAAMEAANRIGDLTDPLPAEVRDRLGMPPRAEAFRRIHRPDSIADADAARRRLAFDELFRMQAALLMTRDMYAAAPGVTHNPTESLTGPYLESLGYPPTGAQTRAIAAITHDMRAPHPMHRLLQGDVGSGKTTVALAALLAAVESGYQAALMAPTEILAWQLYTATQSFEALHLPDGSPVTVAYLASKTKAAEKRRILAGLADGSINVVVGTHALISADVTFNRLGLAVVDEQHRFGVEQRAALRDKGNGVTPDLLVMTATPIPRTIAMTAFGDLDVSVLDEMPPGRTPINTEWVRSAPILDTLFADPWEDVRDAIGQGRQAFIVAPLVAESEKLDAASAEETYTALTEGALAGLRIGLVHGRQPAVERDETMARFRDGDLDAIVATTVIEVGVNVPNATMMIVLDAPRFGLAQLHQLRGRVGRGKHAGRCVLIGDPNSADGVTRMQTMVDTTDGFRIADVDLRLRGAGSVFGASQSGQTDLRVADLMRDTELLYVARDEAATLMEGDGQLRRQAMLRAEIVAAIGDDAEWLTRS